MGERMIGFRVSITRFVSDDQPGFVECDFSDAHGRRWHFVEKTAVVSEAYLDAHTRYPQTGLIACEIVSCRRVTNGRKVVLVDTERPWGVQSVDGSMQFEVLPNSLVEWEWGSNQIRMWDGSQS
jgi:hypothetical protein